MERLIKMEDKGKQIRWGYGIAFFLLVLAYFVTFYANRRLVMQSKQVEDSNKVIINLEVILSKLKDSETGVRGYLISKKTELLIPYYSNKGIIDSVYNELPTLINDNFLHKERLKRLENAYNRNLDLLSDILQVFENNKFQIGDSIVTMITQSKRTMDDCRSEIALLQNEEMALLLAKDKKLKNAFITINGITIASLIIAFLLILFAFITYLRENKARKHVTKEVYDYQDELRRRVEQLNAANAELIRMRSQEKFSATGRIARTIAHEVRNPLTNINLAASQLQSEVIPEDENSGFLFDMISRNSNRINQLISDLLNSTKFSELMYEKISINNLLDETIKEAADRIALSNVQVVKKYSVDICDVYIDKSKISIAFLNIIINALEAMEKKGDGILTVETKGEDEKCKVIITDNGDGIEDESLSRIFEPYFTNKQKGNGLGLTNTQNIILNHKGDIAVISKKGNGTSFTITLNFAP